jgi:hypothetical protein
LSDLGCAVVVQVRKNKIEDAGSFGLPVFNETYSRPFQVRIWTSNRRDIPDFDQKDRPPPGNW